MTRLAAADADADTDADADVGARAGAGAGAGAGARMTAAEVMAALATPEGQADPYPFYATLRAAGPVALAPDGAVLVSGYRACAGVLRDPRMLKAPQRMLAASGFPDWEQHPALRLMFTSLLMINPPGHTRIRHKAQAAFSARRVAALRPAIESVVADLCDAAGSTENFVDWFGFPLPVAVIGETLGIPAADRHMFQSLVSDWATVLEPLTPASVAKADEAASVIIDYLSALAEERRKRPADDLISALGTAEGEEDALTPEEVVTTSALLLGAGFETTTGLLANGLRALLERPQQAARLRGEPSLDRTAATELLRFDPPVQMIYGRTAGTDLEVAGLPVSAGQRVVTILGAANRDPEVFSRPDELHVDRNEEPPLSFGGGIHHCLGARLAQLEVEIALPTLLRRFPRLSLDGPPVIRPGISIHAYTSLPVALH